jgi:group II intron reverse transcriptase/maturase
MRNPAIVLNSLSEHSKNPNYRFERLYRNLFNEEMFYAAYQSIYAKQGQMTKGADGLTIDKMSIARITSIIDSLKNETYQPNPSRRVYIPKKNGKKRPLGIPSFNDKLVQQVVKMMLEAIYEKQFEYNSHGFRPKRSCHTALVQLQKAFTGARWFIEGDIKGFFDNINHDILIKILQERIEDDRFIRLIRKFLNAGYIEDWVFQRTYSGTPQGGIISPILANVYLDKLDKYMNEYVKQFDTGEKRKWNNDYRILSNLKGNVVRKLKKGKEGHEKSLLIEKIKEYERKKLEMSWTDSMDSGYKRLKYVRYADDFLIGVIGSKKDCEVIKEDIKSFLTEKLNLELSEAKTLITHGQKAAKFLGFDIYVRKDNLVKRDKAGYLKRDYGKRVVIEVSAETIRKKLLDYEAMKIVLHNGKEQWKPISRIKLNNYDDLEILSRYNAELRGFYNYYSIANNSAAISSFGHVMKYSMFKTFARKYRSTSRKIIAKLRRGKDFGVSYTNKKGQLLTSFFYNEGYKRKRIIEDEPNDEMPGALYAYTGSSLMERIKSQKCELCDAENVTLEMHHVKRLLDLKGKEPWKVFMIARRRKTLAVCVPCHKKIHSGKID